MKKMIYIDKDELNAIAICRDSFNGVAVQVIRFVDQLVPSGIDQVHTNVRNNQVVNQYAVKIIEGDDFKASVAKAIAQSREFLAGIRKNDQGIDGLLNDYYSQFKDLNEDGSK